MTRVGRRGSEDGRCSVVWVKERVRCQRKARKLGTAGGVWIWSSSGGFRGQPTQGHDPEPAVLSSVAAVDSLVDSHRKGVVQAP